MQRRPSTRFWRLWRAVDINDAHSLVEQLPIELGQTVKGAMSGQDFGVDGFINRVSYREGVDMTEAEIHTRVILEVVKESVSPGWLTTFTADSKASSIPSSWGRAKGTCRAAIDSNYAI